MACQTGAQIPGLLTGPGGPPAVVRIRQPETNWRLGRPRAGHSGRYPLPDAVEHPRVVIRGLTARELHAPQPLRPVLGQLGALERGDPNADIKGPRHAA